MSAVIESKDRLASERTRVRLRSLARGVSENYRADLAWGQSTCTDGKTIWINPNLWFFEGLEPALRYAVLRASAIHEALHILLTNFRDWERLMEDADLNARFAKQVIHAFGNGLEDSRIELIGSHMYAGARQWLRLSNLLAVRHMKVPKDIVGAVVQGFIARAVAGVLPPGFADAWPQVVEYLDRIEPVIQRGRRSGTTAECLEAARECLLAASDLLPVSAPPDATVAKMVPDDIKEGLKGRKVSVPDDVDKSDPRLAPQADKKKSGSKAGREGKAEADAREDREEAGPESSEHPDHARGDARHGKDAAGGDSGEDADATSDESAPADGGQSGDGEGEPEADAAEGTAGSGADEPSTDASDESDDAGGGLGDGSESADDGDDEDGPDGQAGAGGDNGNSGEAGASEANGGEETGDGPGPDGGPDDGFDDSAGAFPDGDGASEPAETRGDGGEPPKASGRPGVGNGTIPPVEAEPGSDEGDRPEDWGAPESMRSDGDGETEPEWTEAAVEKLIRDLEAFARTEWEKEDAAAPEEPEEDAPDDAPDYTALEAELAKNPVHGSFQLRVHEGQPMPDVFRAARAATRRLREDIYQQLKPLVVREPEFYERGRRRGALDTRRLWRAPALGDPHVFGRRRIPYNPSLAVYVLADSSGSMSGAAGGMPSISKADAVRLTLVALADALERLGVPHAVSAFDESSGSLTVNHYRLVRFGQKVGREAVVDYRARANNRDGYSVRVAAEELRRRPERVKLLLVLSDGQPAAIGYGCRDANDTGVVDTRMAVQEARNLGMEVLGFYFGSLTPKSLAIERAMFGTEHLVVVSNLGRLAMDMAVVLQRVITRYRF